MKKKIFSILLSLTMMLTMMPSLAMTSWATGEIQYSITNLAPESEKETNHGYLTIDKDVAVSGDSVKISAEPIGYYGLSEDALKVTASGGATVQVTADADNENIYSFLMPNEDVFVSAEFVFIGTVINFDKQGGTGGTATAEACIDREIPSSVDIPERTGYTFTGYYDETSGGSKYYDESGNAIKKADGNNIKWDKEESTAILYAHWEPIKVKFYLDKNRGYYSDTDYVEVTYYQMIPSVTVPIYSGKYFNGYWDESKNERIIDASGNPLQKTVSKYIEDQHLTACWEDTEHVDDLEDYAGINGLNVDIYLNKSKNHLTYFYTSTDRISHDLYYDINVTSSDANSVEFSVKPMHQAYEHRVATGDATLLSGLEEKNLEMLIYLPNSMRNADRLYVKHVKGDGTTYYMNVDEQVRFDDHIKIYNTHGFDGTDKFVISTEKFNDPEFTGYSLLLGGDIGLNFYMDIPEEFKGGEMTFEVSGKGGFTTSDAGIFVSEYGEYRFTCNLNSLQMGDKVKATYKKDNYNRTEEYSVAEYINTAKTKSGKKMRKLAAKMQAYGYYAQQYLKEIHSFDIGTGDNAYAPIDIPSEEPDLSVDLDKYAIDISANGNTNITDTEISLMLDSQVGLKLHMTLAGGSEYASNMPSITVDGEPLDSDNIQIDGGKMVLSINDIPTLELGHTYTIVVDETYTVKVSALTYAKALMEDEEVRAKQLAAALYEYYQAAMEYAELEEE